MNAKNILMNYASDESIRREITSKEILSIGEYFAVWGAPVEFRELFVSSLGLIILDIVSGGSGGAVDIENTLDKIANVEERMELHKALAADSNYQKALRRERNES